MTRPETSVQGIWELLRGSKLLTLEEATALEERWLLEARDPASLEELAHWLMVHNCATEYQVAMLLHGHANRFFLGSYKLLDRIGKGRLAMVYRAVHRLGQVVAIKVLPPSKTCTPGLLQRFQAEVSLARRLDHPNVVRTLDIGEENGLHYLVMEYLEGRDLQEELYRRVRLPVTEAVGIVYQALLGLQHLSEFGLVHRNLEPANLMLVRTEGGTTDDKSVIVKLLDISLSRACFDEAASAHLSHPRWAGDGSVPGAPAYMAPEQARAPHDADIRADIYSLGCILYHALAGQPPFVDADPLRLMIRHATQTPPPLTSLNPDVPDKLAQIVSMMMTQSPRQRYQTPEHTAKELSAFLFSAIAAPSQAPEPPPIHSPPSVTAPTDSPLSPVPPPEASPVPSPPLVSDRVQEPQADTLPVSIDVELIAAPRVAERPSTPFRWHPARRDLLCLLLGAIGLLLAELIGWLLARLVAGRRGDSSGQ